MGDGVPAAAEPRAVWFYPARSKGGRAALSAGFTPRLVRHRHFIPNACTGRPPAPVCDEFPFWTTNQAVNLSGERPSLRRFHRRSQSAKARTLAFYRKCHVDDNDGFMVLPREAVGRGERTELRVPGQPGRGQPVLVPSALGCPERR